MNLENYIKNLGNHFLLDDEQKNNYEFFLACIKFGRLDVALNISKFITKEFLEEYSDEVIEIAKKRFPSSLKDSSEFRNFLLERKEYELLANIKYALLMEIHDQQVLSELDKIADKEISSGTIYKDYTKYRAMKLRRFELFYDSSFPYDREFVDLFYEDIITFIDKVRFTGPYVFAKAMENGDFEIAEKQNIHDLEDETLDKVVNQYWNKVLEYNENGVSKLFRESKLLFNYYLQNKIFDRLVEFSNSLFTKEIISQYETEIMATIENRKVDIYKNNVNIFNLCLKNRRFDLCAQFDVEFDSNIIQMYGVEILKYIKKIPYSLQNNVDFFNLVLENERFDLVSEFNPELITNEILQKYGTKIIQQFTNIPYIFRTSSTILKLVLSCKKYDLIDQFYEEAFIDEILSLPDFLEYLKVTKNLPYFLYKKVRLEEILKIGRMDLVKDFSILKEAFTDEIIEKYGLSLIDNLNYIPYSLFDSLTLLKKVIEAKRFDLIDQFNVSIFTDELLNNLIDIIPINIENLPNCLINEKAIRLIINKGRYDLLSAKNIYKNVFTEEIFKDYAEILLTKMSFLNIFSNSNSLLKYALEHQMTELIPKFSIRAYDDDLIKKYGETLYHLLVDKFLEADVSLLNFGFLRNNKKIELKSLLILFMENGMNSQLYKFSPDCFTDEIIEKYYDLLLPALNEVKSPLRNNKYLFTKVLKSGQIEYFKDFEDSLITNEIIDKYLEELLDCFTNKEYFPYNLTNNSYFLERVIQLNRNDLLIHFSIGAFTEEIINKHFNYILNYVKNNNEIPPNFQNTYLFDKFLKEGLVDYAITMIWVYFSKKYIEKNYNTLVSLAKRDYESSFSKNLFYNREFVEIFIKDCSLEEVKYIDKNLFLNGMEQYYPKLIEWIIKYNNSMIPEELVSYEKLKCYCRDNGYDDLYLNFTMDTSNNSQMDVATIINQYSLLLGIDKEELKSKLNFLYLANDEILRTLLPKMLNERYKVLNLKHLLTICLYPDLQYEIINLNDKELLLIDRILDVTDDVEYDSTTILYNVLKNFKYYKHLINDIENINYEQIYNLIYILQRNNNVFGINSIEDLSNHQLLEKMLYKFNQFDIRIATKNDIQSIRDMLLLKKYGIDLTEASFICERYCRDIEIVLKSDLNEYLKLLLVDIYDIIYCENIDEIKFKYSSSDLVIPDFKSMLYLEAYIREEYAKLYDKTLYKIKEEDKLKNNEHIIENSEALEKIRTISYNGKKPEIYLLRDDFNLEIHALGAYSGYKRPENFLDDWNRPKMASHGICTSYIGNNQIANARAYHPILGFDSIGGTDLLLAANYDIGSSIANQSYATSREVIANFLPPEENINYTRHTHNEIVIERMKYVGNVARKRMPSYIVYLLDDVNNKYNFMTKNELIEEFENSGKDNLVEEIKKNDNIYFIDSLLKDNKISQEDAKKISYVYYYEEIVQSAIDMNLPILIVDRLYYAKREQKKCSIMYEQLLQTGDASNISKILLTYFNNMIGCIDYNGNGSEYCTYFNDDGFDKLFNKLLNDIENMQDINIKLKQLNVLAFELEKESYKRNSFTGGAPRQLKSLKIYQDKVNKKMEEINLSITEGYNGKNI